MTQSTSDHEGRVTLIQKLQGRAAGLRADIGAGKIGDTGHSGQIGR